MTAPLTRLPACGGAARRVADSADPTASGHIRVVRGFAAAEPASAAG
ncbi:hypothetical protein [Actinokineospora iranica]|nr:hypothetical protein [Actinokineospora iranica]